MSLQPPHFDTGSLPRMQSVFTPFKWWWPCPPELKEKTDTYHWPPPNPNTHPPIWPAPALKLHSNGLNGAFTTGPRAAWCQDEGSSWQFMSHLKVNCKTSASIMNFHLAKVNTAQLVQQLNQIDSSKFLSNNHGGMFSELCHIHQREKLFICCNLQPTGRVG